MRRFMRPAYKFASDSMKNRIGNQALDTVNRITNWYCRVFRRWNRPWVAESLYKFVCR